MVAEDMAIGEALVIAVHANRHPAHVKHTALRVLAQAYKVEHARVGELESEVRQYREDMAAVSDAIGARGVATTPGLLSFIAKLGEQNGTEWGVRRINDPAVPDDGYAVLRDLSVARNIVARDPAHWELVNRIPPGPWQAAT